MALPLRDLSTPPGYDCEPELSVGEQINVISRTYAGQIQNAILRGQTQEAQDLMEKMRVEIDALVQKASATDEPPPLPGEVGISSSFYHQEVCRVDLEKLVFDGDREILTTLLGEASFQSALETAIRENPPQSGRKDLLKKCLHLNPRLAPRLHALGQDCRQTLGLVPNIEFYVYQDQLYNAALVASKDDRTLLIMVSSALLESYDDDELRFVIGHEIGHHIFEHRRLPAYLLLDSHNHLISPIQAMRIYAWKRAAEISADRVGLLCARSFDSALRAFFKGTSGIGLSISAYQISEYAGQLAELEKELTDGSKDPSDWYSTHPFSPLRMRALELFSQSETYFRMLGVEGGLITEAALEKSVYAIMSIMEPAVLQDGHSAVEMIRSFMFHAGVDIASADGVIAPEELQIMTELAGKFIDLEQVKAFVGKPTEERWAILKGLAENVYMNTALAMRLNIIRDLTLVARADGHVAPEEVNLLCDYCSLLGVKQEFVHHVLANVSKPLD